MTLRIQMLSEEVQALQRELRNHPKLAAHVMEQSKTFEDCIAHIAEHLGIILHGIYDEEAVNKLCQTMVNKLQDERKVIITSVADPRMQT